LSSLLLSKSLKIRMYKTVILPLVLYECETWSVTLREHRWRVFENRVLRRIYVPRMEEMVGTGEDCIMWSFVTCKLHKILFGLSNQGR